MKLAYFYPEECNWLYVQDTSAIAADYCLGTYFCVLRLPANYLDNDGRTRLALSSC